MARGKKSHIRKKARRRGCLSGCLTNVLMVLGLLALLFVGACMLGIVKNDPQTGAPSLSLDGLPGLGNIRLPQIRLPELALPDVKLPGWPYGLRAEGLTVKTLRAGEGEAVLVCADGYTMLLGGGSGSGVALTGQLLLCGVNHLNAAVAMSSGQSQIGGLPMAITLMPPQYLIYQSSQTKGIAYNRLMGQAEQKGGIQTVAAKKGLTFNLGRARVSVIGPTWTPHTDERDDGLSLRIDYGSTSVLVMGSVTASGEREMISARASLKADALICSMGGGEEATCAELVSAVTPRIALLTGKKPADAVVNRLLRAGAQVYTAKEHGVMTLYSDGQKLEIRE